MVPVVVAVDVNDVVAEEVCDVDPEVVTLEVAVDVCVVNSHDLNRPSLYCSTRLFKSFKSSESHFTLINPKGSWHLNVAAIGAVFNPFLLNSDIIAFMSTTLFGHSESFASCKLLDCWSMQLNASFGELELPKCWLSAHSCKALVNTAVDSVHLSSSFTYKRPYVEVDVHVLS